jgi:hypothetical protein
LGTFRPSPNFSERLLHSRFIIEIMRFNVDAFLDGFTGAGLFGRLCPPNAPSRLFAEGATVDEMPLAVRARIVEDVLLARTRGEFEQVEALVEPRTAHQVVTEVISNIRAAFLG